MGDLVPEFPSLLGRQRLGRDVGMPADCGSQSGDSFGQLDPGPVVACIVADIDDGLNPDCASLVEGAFGSER